jgi:hypothetical protein
MKVSVLGLTITQRILHLTESELLPRKLSSFPRSSNLTDERAMDNQPPCSSLWSFSLLCTSKVQNVIRCGVVVAPVRVPVHRLTDKRPRHRASDTIQTDTIQTDTINRPSRILAVCDPVFVRHVNSYDTVMLTFPTEFLRGHDCLLPH